MSLRPRLRKVALRVRPEAVRERVRERMELPQQRTLLRRARAGTDACWMPTDEPDPLVSVCIPTFGTEPEIVVRAVDSALAQTHERIEVVVVGDHCDDRVGTAVCSIPDDRVRFVNVGSRSEYPEHPHLRWYISSSAPRNVGLALARGAWIAPCDDDDELTEDHVEVLLAEARARDLEMVYSRARVERVDGSSTIVGRPTLERGRIVHGTVLYASPLRFLRYSETCWKLHEGEDWNLWRRMQRLGVRIGFLDHITYIYYDARAASAGQEQAR